VVRAAPPAASDAGVAIDVWPEILVVLLVWYIILVIVDRLRVFN